MRVHVFWAPTSPAARVSASGMRALQLLKRRSARLDAPQRSEAEAAEEGDAGAPTETSPAVAEAQTAAGNDEDDVRSTAASSSSLHLASRPPGLLNVLLASLLLTAGIAGGVLSYLLGALPVTLRARISRSAPDASHVRRTQCGAADFPFTV